METFQVIKKAWKVTDPEIWDEHPLWEYVYAENASKAKVQCENYDSYLNIQCKRCPEADIVLFEGREVARYRVESELRERERVAKRTAAVEKFPANATFYIQNGYVGNSVLWWALNGNGYTTDLSGAQKYTKEQVLKQFVNGREEDKIWLAEHVEQNIRQHVDGQYLRQEYKA